MKALLRIVPFALAASAVAATAAASSFAADSVQVQSRTIQFDRSAAQTPEGARALYSKIRSAAKDVCFDGGVGRQTASWDKFECAAVAVDEAVKAVNLRTVDELHGRTGTVELIANR